jgi:hypothetical protein
MMWHRSPIDKALAAQLDDFKLWSIAISLMLCIMKVRSEIRTSAWCLVVLTEAGSAAGIVPFAAARAKICAPASSRTGTSNRIELNFSIVLILMVSLRSSNSVTQFYIQRLRDGILQNEFPAGHVIYLRNL